jgi:2-polyprenyl-6-methoxyphenol hydroxylase-like FAD-dependent oxidoreductase
MARVEKVLVVGAGVGGMSAGAALAQQGIETDVVEIRPNNAHIYGVGINQPGNSLRALRKIGVLEEVCSVGAQFDGWSFHDPEGRLVVHCPSRLGQEGVPDNNGLSRKDLHAILHRAATEAGATVTYDLTVSDFEQEGGPASVTFSDGRTEDYDLVVAFDGIKSPLRRRLFGDAYDPVYTGHAVWRLTVGRPPEAVNGSLFQAVGAKAGYIPLSPDTMYLLLVTPEPQGTRYPPERFAEMLRERLAPFGGIIGEIRDNIREGDDIVFSPLSEVMLPQPWYQGRILLCGDAAHACTPHLTQGAAMALEDTVVLADELKIDRPIEETLAAFSTRRYPRAKFVQDASRGILDAEMSITAETLAGALEHMREALPGAFAHVGEFLGQPA